MTLAPFFARQRRGGATPAYGRDPYREMQDINDRFGQLVRAFFGDPLGLSAVSVPADVEETDDAYVVDVDLPNVNPDEVTIEMRGEELRIAGAFQDRERTGTMRRQHRPTGAFEYVVDLPGDIEPARVDATYDNGVLRVTVGRKRDAQPRRIEIHQGELRRRAK